jgi:RNA polymerase sigma-70 factor, ECF subfamily
MNQDEATRAVNELFETLAPFLMRYALRGTRSAETAEDLVQEVFMALYRDLRNGKHIDDLRAWTIGAVRNQVRKCARSSRLHCEDLLAPEAFDMMPGQAWVVESPDVDTDFGPEALRVLTRREEEVVLLRLQSMKYREIGQQLGISSKSVCTLLARAVKKLQLFCQSKPTGGKLRTFDEREVPNALQ